MSDSSKSKQEKHFQLMEYVSPGLLVITLLAVFSSLYVFMFSRVKDDEGMVLWTFGTNHIPLYEVVMEEWNQTEPVKASAKLLDQHAIKRRVASSFYFQLPVADLVEVNPQIVASLFAGPVDGVGFYDLTDKIEEEGLFDVLNPPSFTPWTKEGRVFGLPHDVHPVLLAYRADIIEAAGVDMSQVETWMDLMEALRPLCADLDGDGYQDRFALEAQVQGGICLPTLIYQGGGGYFNEQEQVDLVNPENIRVVSHFAFWQMESQQLAIDEGGFDATAFSKMLSGRWLTWIAPDWRCGGMKVQAPNLAGKVKLMPLPAWEPGGRRTSACGGTMLGIPKVPGEPELPEIKWKLAKALYINQGAAREQWRTQNIVTPVKTLWDDPIYAERDPYFCDQQTGLMYIEYAPQVPTRISSPYIMKAENEVTAAALRLRAWGESNAVSSPEELYEKAREFLARAEENVRRQMERNVFIDTDSES